MEVAKIVGCASLAFATLWPSGDNSVLAQRQMEFRVSTLGAERFEGHWWLGQEENGFVAYDQFTLWDLADGKVVASSPRFRPAESHRNFLLSPIGNAALLYPETAGGDTLSFYERQQTP